MKLSETNFEMRCTKCKITKPLKDFYQSPLTGSGYNSWCKDCFRKIVRNGYLKRTYGIDEDEYERLLALQDYGCAICQKKTDTVLGHGVNKMMAVDHNHQTGQIRGILCENCNRALGLFNDNKQSLQNAINYLNQF